MCDRVIGSCGVHFGVMGCASAAFVRERALLLPGLDVPMSIFPTIWASSLLLVAFSCFTLEKDGFIFSFRLHLQHALGNWGMDMGSTKTVRRWVKLGQVRLGCNGFFRAEWHGLAWHMSSCQRRG